MKKYLLLLAVFIFSLGVVPAFAHAATYYVSPTGDDSNSGTSPAQAWQTIDRVEEGTFTGGDSILFEGGATFAGQLLIGSTTMDQWGDPTAKVTSADELSPVTFGSYGTGRAIINSPVGGGSDDDGIDAFNVGGIVIKDLMLTGHSGVSDTDYGWYSAGIKFANSINGDTNLSYIKIENVEVSGYDTGIEFDSYPSDGSDSGYDNVQILNNTIHDGTATGIAVYGSDYGNKNGFAYNNFEIRGNTVYNITGIPVADAPDSEPTGNGIGVGEIQNSVIENNIVHDCGSLTDNSSGPVGIMAYDSKNITIQFNEVYNQKTNGSTDGGGFDFDGGVSDSVMQYNYTHDNYGPGYMFYSYNDGYVTTWGTNTMRYNISQNDASHNTNAYGAIEIWADSTMTNAYIYNNTVYDNNSGSALIAIPGSATLTGKVANNIFYAANSNALVSSFNATPPAASSFLFAGNDYYTTGTPNFRWHSTNYSSLSAWQSATGQEKLNSVAVGSTADPALTNAGGAGVANGYNPQALASYLLLSTSPMINSGLNLSANFGLSVGNADFFGNSIPLGSNYDIGADEANPNAGNGSVPNESSGGHSVTLTAPPLNNLGLVGYWPLDGNTMNWTTGLTNDTSGYSTNISLAGFSTTTSPTNGKIGQALTFNRSDSQELMITTPSSALDVPTYTESAWVKFNSNNQAMFLIEKGTTSNYDNFYLWYNTATTYCDNSLPSGAVLIAGYDDSAASKYHNLCASFTPTIGQWYLLTETFDGSNIRLYINGVLKGTESTPSGVPYTSQEGQEVLGIGGASWVPFFSADYFNGVMDDVRIYNRALSSTEVTHLYNAGSVTLDSSDKTQPQNLTDSLVGYWPFDGNDTNWVTDTSADVSTNGYGAHLVGLSNSTASVSGVLGQALYFPGIEGEYASVTPAYPSALGNSTTKTISAWVQVPTSPPAHNQAILMYGGFYSYDYGLWYLSSGRPDCHFNSGGSYDFGINLSPNQWYLLTCTLDSTGKVSMYVNGSLTSTATGASLTATQSGAVQLAIGWCPDTGFCKTSSSVDTFFQGRIDDMRIYNRALSASEVTELYNLGAGSHAGVSSSPGSLSSDLGGWWTFDGKNMNWATSVVTDSSGQGNNGTMQYFSTSTSPVAGRLGQALSFNGVSSDVILPSTSAALEDLATQPTTYSAWVKIPQNQGGIIMARSDDNSDSGWLFFVQTGHKVGMTNIVSNHNNRFLSTNAVVPNNTWTLLTVTSTGIPTASNDFTLYVNGVPVSSTDDAGIGASTDDSDQTFYLGYNIYADTAPQYFTGTLDDVRIYNRILSPSEIKQLYALGR